MLAFIQQWEASLPKVVFDLFFIYHTIILVKIYTIILAKIAIKKKATTTNLFLRWQQIQAVYCDFDPIFWIIKGQVTFGITVM